MKKDTENKLTDKNTKPTSMRILVYDFLADQKMALSLTEIEEQLYYADRTTIYRTLKTFEKKVLYTVFRKIRPQNTNYAMMNVMKIRIKTGICISTAKYVNKPLVEKISF